MEDGIFKMKQKTSKKKILFFVLGGIATLVILGIYEVIFYLLMDYLGLISMFFIWLPVFPVFIINKIIPINLTTIILLSVAMWFFVGGWITIKRFFK